MKIHKVDLETKHGKGFFLLWVCAWDTHDWKIRPALFKYEDGKVYFVIVGRHGENRFAGEARNMDEAIAVATNYLEWWLRECDALERPGRPLADCEDE